MANVKLSERGKAFLKRGTDATKVANYLVKEGGKSFSGEPTLIPVNNGTISVQRSNSSSKTMK